MDGSRLNEIPVNRGGNATKMTTLESQQRQRAMERYLILVAVPFLEVWPYGVWKKDLAENRALCPNSSEDFERRTRPTTGRG